MSRAWMVVLGGMVAATSCSTKGDESPMPEMTAEEHAQMLAGGTQGEVDTTGALVRQTVHLTKEQERALGVAYTTARTETLTRTIRTVGEVKAPEPNLANITPKIEGFVERLFVASSGESVRRGQPVLSLYSPQLVAAQEELLTARRLADRVDSTAPEAWRSAQSMLEAARRRLAYWDITAEQIARIEETGEVTKTLTLVAPVTGIVLEKLVIEGQQVMPGMLLYRMADLSSVWVEGDLFEQDIQFVRVGAQAHIEVAAYPGEHVMGKVSFVYPTIDQPSRTNRVRVTVSNRNLRLKPGMFATIYFDVTLGDKLLTVPMEAVIVTGERNLVFVRDTAGMLGPRDVVLGARAGDRVVILAGLSKGEEIVASANFLVDAESRLGSTGGGMPGMQHGAIDIAPDAPAPPRPAEEHDHD
ncbi:MAG TPA: efflux RND transporter periplasmic adaptor subunit [Gemmatimonadales bacterium]|nr:efflux RND transporter periplasmic adaptor subunit [Gemmatimonadales bacterium]